MKIDNKRELQNIAINHSIDIKDLQKMYKGTIFFLEIDKTLPASDSLRFRKSFFSSCKDDSNLSA